MNELLTAAQMRAIEQAAIASGKVTGLELMERAGQGVVDAIFAHWPLMAPSPEPTLKTVEGLKQRVGKQALRVVVLCGPGNNGGDGFVVARLLRQAGWDVEVFLYGDASKLPPDARTSHDKWQDFGITQSWEKCTSERWKTQPLVVDAVFGTGLSRPIPDDVRNVLMATLNCPRVAVDLPSLLSADTGRALSAWPADVPAAQLTVTFHRAKSGHYLADGPGLCGRLHIADIGLDATGNAPLIADREVLRLCRAPSAKLLGKGHGHKYSHGHVIVLSGGAGKGGAARLAARGALRVGAGAVTIGCPPATLVENAAQLNAVMLQSVKGAEALSRLLEDTRINALCIGPGFGTGTREKEILAAAIARRGPGLRPTVLDADALTLLAQDEALFAMLHAGCVLTPHAGEFARLFPDIAERLNGPAAPGPPYSKADATRDAAKRAGCIVLFKGPDTVIAAPDGRCNINASVYQRAAPWLATAGSGDVLAGFIVGLLARGLKAMQAAGTGAWLHTQCALCFGPGLIADDLPEMLPAVMRDLGV